MATAVKAIEQVRDAISAGHPGDPSWPVKLEVGPTAHRLIGEAAGWVSTHTGRPLSAVYGVEMVQIPEYDRRWQLLGPTGAVIVAGDVEG